MQSDAVLVASILSLGSLFWLFRPFPLPRVRMDQTSLYIEQRGHEISVPLTEVTDVVGARMVLPNGRPGRRGVLIEFRNETAFGRAIAFAPAVRFTVREAPHPVVAELRTAAGLKPETTPAEGPA